jgi:asparagine synthase (glutamine-hydrolysing)
MGFGVPLDQWLRHELKELVHDTLLSASARTREFFRPEAVEKLVRDHEQRVFDRSAALWALLMLEMWLRTWSNSGTPARQLAQA